MEFVKRQAAAWFSDQQCSPWRSVHSHHSIQWAVLGKKKEEMAGEASRASK